MIGQSHYHVVHSAHIMSSSKYKEKYFGQFYHHVFHVLKENMANYTPMYLFIVQKYILETFYISSE